MKITKKQKFLEYCRKKKFVSSVMALEYALNNNFLCAKDMLSELSREGHAERLNSSQKHHFRLLRGKVEIAWYCFNKDKWSTGFRSRLKTGKELK